MSESRSIKAIILASGQSLTLLVGIISAAVLSRLLSQHDYATYRETLLSYTFASPFVVLGLNQALFYFLPNEKERSRGVLIENLALLLLGGLILMLFLLLGGNYLLARRFNNPDLVRTLLILAPYPLLMIPTGAISACLLARNRAAQVAKYNVSSRIIMLLAVVAPSLVFPSPTTAIIGSVVGAGITSVTAMTLMIRACNTGGWRPTLDGMKKQVKFSVPLGMSTLLGSIAQSLDQVFVAAICAPAAFAVFVNGAMEVPLVAIVTGSVTSVLIVDYARLYKEGKTDEIVEIIHRAMVKCALILIPAMAFLMCVAPELMRVVYGAKYGASADPFRVYLLLWPLRTLTYGAVFMATGRSRLILAQAIIPLIGKLLFTTFAIEYYGPIGAPVTTVLLIYFLNTPYSLTCLCKILHKRVDQMFPWVNLFKVGLASFVPTIPVLAFKAMVPMHDVVSLAATGCIYLLLTLLLIGWLGLVDVRQLLAEIHLRIQRQFGRPR